MSHESKMLPGAPDEAMQKGLEVSRPLTVAHCKQDIKELNEVDSYKLSSRGGQLWKA